MKLNFKGNSDGNLFNKVNTFLTLTYPLRLFRLRKGNETELQREFGRKLI